MGYKQSAFRESCIRQLEGIGKAGKQHFHARLQPMQRQMLKVAVGVLGFIPCLALSFASAKHLTITPLHALFVFGPVMMGVPLMALAASGITKYQDLCRKGTRSWYSCLAGKVADYSPECHDAYEHLVSSMLSNSLTEEALEAWLSHEYSALFGGGAIPPDHFDPRDWQAVMRLSGRYEDIKS